MVSLYQANRHMVTSATTTPP